MKFEKLAWYQSRPNGLCFIFALLFLMQIFAPDRQGEPWPNLFACTLFLLLSFYFRKCYRSDRAYLFTKQEVEQFKKTKEAKVVLSFKSYFLRITISFSLAYLVDYCLYALGLNTEPNSILIIIASIYSFVMYPSEKREQERWDSLVSRAKESLKK